METGGISRLLLNLELKKDGFPPIVIKVKNRLDYYEVLDKAHTKKIAKAISHHGVALGAAHSMHFYH